MTGYYTIIMMLYWADYAVVYGYSSVYLLGAGFTNTQIGFVLAAAAAGAMLVQFMITDRMKSSSARSVKQVITELAVCFLAAALFLTGAVRTAESRSLRLLLAAGTLYGVMVLIMQALTPFVNSLSTISSRKGTEINFGVARGMGSGAYSLASLLCGRASDAAGIQIIPILAIPVCMLFFLLVLLFPVRTEKKETGQKSVGKTPPGSPDAGAQKSGTLSLLRKYPDFALVLSGTLFLYTCNLLINTYGYQIVRTKGGGNREFGIGIAIAAMTETPVMIFLGIRRKQINAGKWITVTGIFFFVRTLGYLLLPSVAGYYLMQLLQVVTWAVLGVVTVYYVSGTVQPDDEVRGQTCFTMAVSLGTVLSSVLGGFIIDWKGIDAMLVCAAACAAAGTALTAAARKKKAGAAENRRKAA